MKYLNKLISTILLVILCLCCITGCAAQKQTADDSSLIAADPPQEESDSWSELADLAVQKFQQTEFPGVYHIESLDLPNNHFYSAIALHERYIAMLIGEYGEFDIAEVVLKVFDMAENRICLEKVMSNDVCGIEFFSNGTFYISFYSGEILVYDLSGHVVKEYAPDLSRGTLYMDKKDRLWYFDNDALWCLDDGQKTSYDVPFSTLGSEIISVENEIVRYSYFTDQSETAAYNIKTGKTDRWELYSYLEAGKQISFRQTENGTFQYAFEENKIYSTNLNEERYILSAELMGNFVYIKTDEALTILDIAHSKTGEISFEDMYLNWIASDGVAHVFTGICRENECVYYLKDCKIPLSDIEIQEKTLTDKQQQNTARAAEIYEKYGLSVKSIPLEADTEINYDYKNTEDVTDIQMEEFLSELKIVLKEYPKDFFRNLANQNVTGVCVMLCNGLKGISENTLMEAGGVSYASAGVLYIAINTDQIYNLKSTFSHEVFHTIENALIINDPESAPFEHWNTLNPDDFVYGRDYTAYNETSGKYVFDYTDEHLSRAYFITEYGTVNELEDRAEIFAEMTDPYEMFFRAPHIYKKAEYLAETLKHYYPEWYEDGTPLWMAYKIP